MKSSRGKSRLRRNLPNLDKIVKEIALFAFDKKAEDVIILDLRKVSDATDYFIMGSGDTDIQVRAIADYIIEKVKEIQDFKPWHIEGYRYGKWILLDYIDFVVHVFEKGTRDYYQLERLWGDAVLIELEDEP